MPLNVSLAPPPQELVSGGKEPPPMPPPREPAQEWRVGQRVEMRDEGDGQWQRGTVTAVLPGGPEVRADGEDQSQPGVPYDEVRPLAEKEAAAPSPSLPPQPQQQQQPPAQERRRTRPDLGHRVYDASGHSGTVSYVGFLHRAADTSRLYAGIEWDEEGAGAGDGCAFGERYFSAPPRRGGWLPLVDTLAQCPPPRRPAADRPGSPAPAAPPAAAEQRAAAPEGRRRSGPFAVGDLVEMRDQGMEWERGVVTSADPLEVRPDGDEEEDGVPYDEVRPRAGESADGEPAAAAEGPAEGPRPYRLLLVGVDRWLGGALLGRRSALLLPAVTLYAAQGAGVASAAAAARRAGWSLEVVRTAPGGECEAAAMAHAAEAQGCCCVVAAEPGARAERAARLLRLGFRVVLTPPACLGGHSLRQLEGIALGWAGSGAPPLAELLPACSAPPLAALRRLAASERVLGTLAAPPYGAAAVRVNATAALFAPPAAKGGPPRVPLSWAEADIDAAGGPFCSAAAAALAGVTDGLIRPAAARYEHAQRERYRPWGHDYRLRGARLWPTELSWEEAAGVFDDSPCWRAVRKLHVRRPGLLPAACLGRVCRFAAAPFPDSLAPHLRHGKRSMRLLRGGAADYQCEGVAVRLSVEAASREALQAGPAGSCWDAAEVFLRGTRCEIALYDRAGKRPRITLTPVPRRWGGLQEAPITRDREGPAETMRGRGELQTWREHLGLGAAERCAEEQRAALAALLPAAVDALRAPDDSADGPPPVIENDGHRVVITFGQTVDWAAATSRALEDILARWRAEEAGRQLPLAGTAALLQRWRLLCAMEARAIGGTLEGPAPAPRQ
eukprot:TRINITY_DN9431_c1_g3_i1.p1 TRINITY_DN9431_c1_g3~~TRINITY_DN9431_c1_g3_i1.p1  ORF type:complete len:841 (+),score=235.12 TRINITY_DN9431_c1_g3_i1:2-2524(+)